MLKGSGDDRRTAEKGADFRIKKEVEWRGSPVSDITQGYK
jgi:hypothetical protein